MTMKVRRGGATTVVSEAPGRDDVALGAAAALFRGFGDPSRLAIVCHLALGEHNVRDLTEHLGLAQSTVSAHLRCLLDCGRQVSRPGHMDAVVVEHGVSARGSDLINVAIS